jgi:hypothetical protein
MGDGRSAINDCRGIGNAWKRHQLPERFPVEKGEGKGDSAGLAKEDDPLSGEGEIPDQLFRKHRYLFFKRHLQYVGRLF